MLNTEPHYLLQRPHLIHETYIHPEMFGAVNTLGVTKLHDLLMFVSLRCVLAPRFMDLSNYSHLGASQLLEIC